MNVLMLANWMDRLGAVPPVWHVLWAGLACLSLALVVLSRTRWGQSKPMHKCAALSLLAHALMACFATTVKIVTTAETAHTPPAVHVSLVSGEGGTMDRAVSAPQVQPWEGLTSVGESRPEVPRFEPPDEEVQSLLAAFSEPFDAEPEVREDFKLPAPDPLAASAPDDDEPAPSPLEPAGVELPQGTPASEPPPWPLLLTQELIEPLARAEGATSTPAPEAWEANWKSKDPATSVPEAHAPANLLPPIHEHLHEDDGAAWVDDASSPPLAHEPSEAAPLASPHNSGDSQQRQDSVAHGGGLTPLESIADGSGWGNASRERVSAFGHRNAEERARLVQEHGGTEQTEAAVERALAWLARAQSQDGRWDAVRHGSGRELIVYGHDRQGAGAGADTGVTGLALLAFLGAGHTHVDGQYQQHVQQGLDFLVSSQKQDGNLCGGATLYARMYCHAMAAFALSEAYAMTGDEALAAPVRKAVTYTVAAQHSGGGWRYRPGDPGDTSQLGWQLMALRSAELAGVSIPRETWRRAGGFLQSVSRGTAGGLAAYQPGTGVSRAMSAEATYCKLLLADREQRTDALRLACDETAEYLSAEVPGTGRANFYYWYYATLLLHLRQHDSGEARDQWRTWNEALQQVLLATQHQSGPLDGAWASDTVWGGYGGRVYTTALAALCLETYYRYLPFLENPHQRTVSRPGLLHQPAFDTTRSPGRID